MPDNLASFLEKYEVAKATMEEADDIIHLLKEVAQWIQEIKIDQWRSVAEGQVDEEIKEMIMREQVYIVKKGKNLVATFTLYENQGEWDRYLWGDLQDGAIYIHRLAVALSKKGGGLGRGIIQWIENKIKQEGKTIVRLDCVAHNKKLNDFYRRCGYTYLGRRHDFSLYEKKLVE